VLWIANDPRTLVLFSFENCRAGDFIRGLFWQRQRHELGKWIRLFHCRLQFLLPLSRVPNSPLEICYCNFLGPWGQTQSVHLADDRVPRNAAETFRYLASTQPFGPKLLQLLNPLIGPRAHYDCLREKGAVPRKGRPVKSREAMS